MTLIPTRKKHADKISTFPAFSRLDDSCRTTTDPNGNLLDDTGGTDSSTESFDGKKIKTTFIRFSSGEFNFGKSLICECL